MEEKLQAALDAHISIKLKAFGERIKLKQLLQDRYGLLMRAEANQEVLTSLNDEIAALQTADDIASVRALSTNASCVCDRSYRSSSWSCFGTN